MKGTKRKKSSQEPDNIKRWRSEITSYTGQGDKEEDPNAVKNKIKPLTRKEKRKEGRQLKKLRNHAFSQHTKLPTHESLANDRESKVKAFEKKRKQKEKRKRNRENKRAKLEAEREEEDAKKKAYDEEVAKDDKTIKQLEKQMKMNKRKSKSLPQSFQNDGLDFILDVVDSDKLKGVIEDDDDDELTGPLLDSGSDEEEHDEENMEESDNNESESGDDQSGAEDVVPEITGSATDNVKGILKSSDNTASEKKVQFGEIEESAPTKKNPKNKKDLLDFIQQSIAEVKSAKKVKANENEDMEDDSEMEDDDLGSEEDLAGSDSENEEGEELEEEEDSDEEEIEDEEEGQESSEEVDGNEGQSSEEEKEGNDEMEEGESSDEEMTNKSNKDKDPEYSEDIYGRLRDKQGNLVSEKKTGGGAYVPPGKRLQMASSQSEKKKIEIERLKKQLKGLINRLSESNIQPISSQIEEMFRSHSRADLSESLTAIIMEACVSTSLIPERLITEQMMLLAILQGNVGNEVGALFLQSLAERLNSLYEEGGNYGDGKQMDNVLVMLASMYNFKMFHSVLIFDVLMKLTDSFQERDIELLLVLLKNVGFSLRKDDPAMLKEVIVKVQEKAGSVNTAQFEDESRVKFMLEVLMAIRNNNMRKIPNYDPTHVEHLRKILRNYTKGSSLSDTQLRISLDDLLSADSRGRWWLVGSAWTGRDPATPSEVETTTATTVGNTYSAKILELARQQRMNTDIRKNIFCTILTSEDFADAFEKLLRLNLKNQQEREIIHVVIDICLQEKAPNPFYAYLAQKFCEFHRRFQMTVQFNFWDRLKILSELSPANIRNLATFMTHLIATKAISLSVFKVVEFSELDKHKLQLVRSILRSLLLDHQEEVITEVFARVAPFPKLATLREALRVFMKHFLLRKLRGTEEGKVLEGRVELAERALGSAEGAMQL